MLKTLQPELDYSGKYDKDANPETGWPVRTPAGVVRFTGEVVKIESQCVRVMSDVWDDLYTVVAVHQGKIVRVDIGYGDKSQNYEWTIDATPEVLATYATLKAEEDRANKAREEALYAERRREEIAREAKTVRKGKTVIVVRGRKVAKGTTGRAFWVGDSTYGVRVGIETASGDKMFTAVSNVEVDHAEIEQEIEAETARELVA